MNTKPLAVTLLLITMPCFVVAQEPTLQPKPEPMTTEELTEAVISLQQQLKTVADRQDQDTSAAALEEQGKSLEEQGKSVASLEEQLRQLAEAIGANTSNLAAVIEQQKTMTEKLQAVSDALGQVQADQAAQSNTIQDINVQLAELKTKHEENVEVVADNSTKIGQISRDIGGSQSLRFDSIQDESSLQEFQRLLKRAAPQQGRLIVENKTEQAQGIRINQILYYLAPGEERAFPVRVGNVSTQLTGQKIINWNITGPDYEEAIQIVTGGQPVPPPVTVNPTPVYIDPVSYVIVP